MSADDDYTAYVGTRWADLVRTAVLLGCPRHEAEELVRSVLVRGYRGWGAAWRDDLGELHMVELLMTAVHDRVRQPTDPADAALPEVAHVVDRDSRTDLARTLDLLDVDQREALVLRHVTELTPGQAARVLGIPVGTVEHRITAAYVAIDGGRQRTAAPPCGGEAP